MWLYWLSLGAADLFRWEDSSMSLAFEVTQDDVENVLASNEVNPTFCGGRSLDQLAQDVFPLLDFQKIEDAALYGDDIGEQTGYAWDEMTSQLRVLGVLVDVDAQMSRPRTS